MNMKIASAIALAMGIAVAGSASAAANDGGTITFNGQLSDTTCTISGGAGTDGGGPSNFTVTLDTIPASTMAAAGDVAANKSWSVQIGAPGQTTCQNGKVASMNFVTSSQYVDASNGALKNAVGSATGGASNVEVQLLTGTGTTINLADPSFVAASPAIANNTAIIPFQAQYLAVNGAPTAGNVSTNVQYQVTYN